MASSSRAGLTAAATVAFSLAGLDGPHELGTRVRARCEWNSILPCSPAVRGGGRCARRRGLQEAWHGRAYARACQWRRCRARCLATCAWALPVCAVCRFCGVGRWRGVNCLTRHGARMRASLPRATQRCVQMPGGTRPALARVRVRRARRTRRTREPLRRPPRTSCTKRSCAKWR